MNKKSLRSVKAELIFTCLGTTAFVFLIMTILYLHACYDNAFLSCEQSLNQTADLCYEKYEDCFSSVERTVHVLEKRIYETIDEERILVDPQYESSYMDSLSYLLADEASSTTDAVAVYFRMEAQRYGGTNGLLLTGNPKTGFISVRPTDITSYSPTDTEHVVWYHQPVWDGIPIWIDPYVNENINMHIISFVVPMYRDEDLLGIVGMDLNMATIKGIANTVSSGSNEMSAIILGKERSLIYSTGFQREYYIVEVGNDIRQIKQRFTETPNAAVRFQWNGQKCFGVSRTLRNGMQMVVAVPYSKIYSTMWPSVIKIIPILIFVIIGLVIILQYLMTEICIPILNLTEASFRLSRGELNIPIVIDAENEVGLLAENSRKMAKQLNEYIEFIREQAKSEHEAKEIALNASKAKSDFLANMSHEIRTPINAVLGMDEMIIRESPNENIRRYAANIKNAGNSLLYIINDILDFSKIESGKMELINEAYDLSTVVYDLISMISNRAKEHHLTFNVVVDPDTPKMLNGDAPRIRQCILNLLTNAVKYTQRGGVTLSISYTQPQDDPGFILLHVNVRDTGIGIKEEDLKMLFSPFERIEEKRNRTIEGTGLGLSIVKNILSLMGSELEVESVYGQGSSFSFTIRQKVISEEVVGDVNEGYAQHLSVNNTYKERLFAPNARILIVDDTLMNLEVIVGLLKNTKIKLDTATSGQETLRLVQENTYDILFIDHRMPEMDGIETLAAMRELPNNKCKDSPCIALTANAISGAKEMYLKAGFTDYLSKPVNPVALEQMIRTYLPPILVEELPASEDPQEISAVQEEEKPMDERLNGLQGIDISLGLSNCGGQDLYIKMLSQFHSSIEENSDAISSYLISGDVQNYRVKVHALKSTSRLIGALELSSFAERLENAADSVDMETVFANTPRLLNMYGMYDAVLSAFNSSDDDAQEDKPIMEKDKFLSLIEEMGRLVKQFNIDGVDSVIEEISRSKVPSEYESIFNNIKDFAQKVDFESLGKIVDELEAKK